MVSARTLRDAARMTEADLRKAAEHAFARASERVLDVRVDGFIGSVTVRCDHMGGRIVLSELIRFAHALDLHETAIELWDQQPNCIEVVIDPEGVTPVEYVGSRPHSGGHSRT